MKQCHQYLKQCSQCHQQYYNYRKRRFIIQPICYILICIHIQNASLCTIPCTEAYIEKNNTKKKKINDQNFESMVSICSLINPRILSTTQCQELTSSEHNLHISQICKQLDEAMHTDPSPTLPCESRMLNCIAPIASSWLNSLEFCNSYTKNQNFWSQLHTVATEKYLCALLIEYSVQFYAIHSQTTITFKSFIL